MVPELTLILGNELVVADLPRELAAALAAALKFPNPKWEENERQGRWNRGVPRELDFLRRLTAGRVAIPRGYIRQLISLCRDSGVRYRIEDRRRTLPAVDFTLQASLKPFQQQALQAMLAKEFGTLCAPTGSGKTVIALAMIAHRRQPAMVVVHTRELADQWCQRIETFLGLPPQEIGMIGGGRARMGERIGVALVQSLYRCAGSVAPQVGFLVVDECHRCPSRTFIEAVSAFDCRFMLGLSATPYRRDRLSRLIFWHLGALHHQVERRLLVSGGHLLAAEVILRQTDFIPFHDPVGEYSQMLAELTSDDRRNRMIVADIAAEVRRGSGICLVLSDRKRHCDILQSMLRFGEKINAERLGGDLSPPRRREVLGRLHGGQVRVLVATGQLLGEGFDCPDLSTLFLATPIRFGGRLLQYLGRVLRVAPGKAKARVYDYVDGHVEVLQAAANARQRVYARGGG